MTNLNSGSGGMERPNELCSGYAAAVWEGQEEASHPRQAVHYKIKTTATSMSL